ncbi:tetratricopeptide repeat protein [Lysobacter hankyongensis]|uniref:Tetratricopeptide repeat protein n=1 Tax=Lysobacter hankyongensis TaxID=1176535 RepID=A0ABP9BX51_9GAMM
MPASPFSLSRRGRRASRFLGLALALASVAAFAADPAEGDPLAPAMAGEYALQAGKLDEAARWYLDAARAAPGDAVLAERATRIALLAKDDARAAAALKLWRASTERSPAMRNAEATLALRRKDERAAFRELQILMRGERGQAPDKDGWRYALLALDAGSGDPKLTGRLLGRLIDSIPDELNAWLAFGEFSQQLQRNDLSEQIVARVVAKFPDEPAVALLRASQLREAGKEDEARKVLAALLESPRGSPELVYAVAREYSELGDHVRAAEVIARGPQNERSYTLRAAYLAQADDKPGVGRVYDELKRDSAAPDPQRRLLLGQIAEFIERHDEALEWYASVPGGPQRWQARLRSATVLHKLKRGEEAFARLRELQADADAEDETRRDAYLLEAELHKDDGKLDAELDSFARGLAAFPDDVQLLYARALMWERRDDIPRAEADFRTILATDADDVNALNALGYTLADRTERYQEALELISRAIAAQPDSAAIIDSYGWVLYRLGRNEEALTELRRAYTKQKDAEIAAHVAEVLWVLGQKDEARRFFEESRKIDPENRSLKRAIEKTGVVLPPLPAKPAA